MEWLSHNEMLTNTLFFWEIWLNGKNYLNKISYTPKILHTPLLYAQVLYLKDRAISTQNEYWKFECKISMLQSINVKHTDFSTRLHLWWSKPISDVYLPLLLATYPHSHLLLQIVVRRNTSTFISSHSQFYCIPGHSSSSIQTQAPRTLFWGLGLGRAECLSH